MLNAVDPAARGVNGSVEAKRFLDVSSAADDLYYFHANVSNARRFESLVSDLFRHLPVVRSEAAFLQLVADARAAYIVAGGAAAQEKARLATKRASVKAKAALKENLNLQEGVSLKGVDVGQYKVILAGLEPVREYVYQNRKTQLNVIRTAMSEALVANGRDIVKTYPDKRNPKWSDVPANFWKFFECVSPSAQIVTHRPAALVQNTIISMAEQFALAYVQGYACKLSVKVGEYIANEPGCAGYAPARCNVSSNNLWSDSNATIVLRPVLGNGERCVTFHTQIIWNRSCLGKVFNQYPTRRVA